jgi:hypothetical protein
MHMESKVYSRSYAVLLEENSSYNKLGCSMHTHKKLVWLLLFLISYVLYINGQMRAIYMRLVQFSHR